AFCLGFSPDEWQALEKYLHKKGVDRKTALDAGLVVEKEGRTYDRFRNRIMFPIANIHGQVLGFGGRVMDDSLPKYLNSPQSPVYDKKRVLYGLGEAMVQARKSGILFVVEGYFDMLALWAAGIKNAAATCGTALSQEHASTMKGYAKKVVLVFDADLAGQKAAERSLPIFMSQGLEASVMVLPQGHDPDSFVREYGAQAFEDAAQKSLSIMDFLTRAALARHGESIQGRAAAADELAAHLRAIDDSVIRSLYIKRVATRLNVQESAIVQKVNAVGKKMRRQPGQEQEKLAPKASSLEKELATMMLHKPDIISSVRERGLLAFFENPAYRAIAQVLIVRARDLHENPDFNLLAFLDDPEQRRLVAELYSFNPDPDPVYLLNLVDQCAARCERMTTAELLNKLKLADEQNDKALRDICLAKLNPKKTRVNINSQNGTIPARSPNQ
ncbi:MAG: toprim domain-containing protein, partial [Desulfatibacillaceae bacterium]|nr:toprim domain-containing protein [Desulfatibacillaceae bacterium]